jgi:acetyl esterase
MKSSVIFFLLITITYFAYSQNIREAQIYGTILNATDKIIKIRDTDVSISENGNFRFQTKMEFSNFIEVKYEKMSWLIYLEPGKNVELEVKASDLPSLNYKGDLKYLNYCLKKTSLLDARTYDYFNNNWAKIHTKDESKYISIIDSIKSQYLKVLTAHQAENKNIPNDFIKLFKADINFGFNILIVDYPEIRRRFTNEKVILSRACCDYLNLVSIDDIKLMDLPSYKRYCRKWIDYNVDILIEKNSEKKHYNLKKIDILFLYLPTILKNQAILDYWLSEYLIEHIQNTWLANSKKYVDKYKIICKTETYKTKINELYTTCVEAEKGHVVKQYKSVNGFNLEAHIFYPDSIKNGEKRSAIVIIHGGGFVLGNPSWAFRKAKHFASMGMIAIAAQYRLSNFKDITPIDAIQDVKDLMFWLRTNADSLKIIHDKIAASGWSVGGGLCASLAIFADTLSNSKINTSPNALLLTSPGTGFGGWLVELMNGAKINPLDYSPVDHVRSGLPPTIILQGRDDTVTPLDGVQLFHDKLVAKGNYCEIWIYDKVGHLFTPTYLGDNGWPRPDKEVQKQTDLQADEFLRKFGYIK